MSISNGVFFECDVQPDIVGRFFCLVDALREDSHASYNQSSRRWSYYSSSHHIEIGKDGRFTKLHKVGTVCTTYGETRFEICEESLALFEKRSLAKRGA